MQKLCLNAVIATINRITYHAICNNYPLIQSSVQKQGLSVPYIPLQWVKFV